MFNITLEPVPKNFAVGPTNFNAPIKVEPSIPNFNLFLSIAAALSLPSNPSKDSGSVNIIFCCNQLPPSSSVLPNIPPSVSCPDADTKASLTPTGSAQYPPNLAALVATLPTVDVAAALFNAFCASFVLVALPNTFFTIFCAIPTGVPYCVSSDTNCAYAGSGLSNNSDKSTCGNTSSTVFK